MPPPFQRYLAAVAILRLRRRSFDPGAKATFERRATKIPQDPPNGLNDAFANDPAKMTQWTAFKRDLGSDRGTLPAVCAHLRGFLMPRAHAATTLQGA
jgi:hypothetical protein